jgi:energy-coupling factor transporter transmembrane protein EcfT
VYLAIIGLFNRIPFIGWLIWLFLLVPWIVFSARYITLLYESAEPATPTAG